MADIRLARQTGTRVWPIMAGFAIIGILLWASALVLGDKTAPENAPRVGAAADFGGVRAPVLPVEAVPFRSLDPLETRDVGRLVRITGVAETGVRANSVWVRTEGGRRIMVRFQPVPDGQLLRGVGAGSTISFNGYLQNIALAEFLQLTDSLGVRIPKPPPARKFGDLPDPAFARVDSLFIKNYYVSVRPEGIRPDSPQPAA